MKTRPQSLALACLLLLAHREASAEPAAVLLLQYGDDVPEARASEVRESVRQGLVRGGLEPLTSTEVDRLLVVTDVACTTGKCLADAAKTLKVTITVGGRLERTLADGNPDWTLMLWLYDTRSAATAAAIARRCQGCTGDQILAWAGDVANQLLGEVDRSQGSRIEVRSTPPGVPVNIDGTDVGITDMTFGVRPGDHSVVLTPAGGPSRTHEVKVPPGQKVLLEVDLTGGTTGARGEGVPAPRVLKWVFTGAALAGIGAGIALLAINGNETCTPEKPHYPCPERYETLAPGLALTIGGAVVGAVAGVMFYLDRDMKKEPAGDSPKVTISPGFNPRGPGLNARITF